MFVCSSNKWNNPYHYINTYEKWLEFLEVMEVYCMNYWLDCTCTVDNKKKKKNNYRYIINHEYKKQLLTTKEEQINAYILANFVIINTHQKNKKGETLIQKRSIINLHDNGCYSEYYPTTYETYILSPWRLLDYHDENMRKIWGILSIPKNLYISHKEREEFHSNFWINYKDKYKKYFWYNDDTYNLHTMINDFRDMRKKFHELLAFMNKFKDDEIVGFFAKEFGTCLPYIRKYTMSLIMDIIHKTDNNRHALEMILVIMKTIINERNIEEELSIYNNTTTIFHH